MQSKSRIPVFLMLLISITVLTPVKSQEKIPLRVRMGDVSVNKIPFLIALDEGLYEKHGLDVDMVPFSARAAEVHGIEGASRHIHDIEPDITVGGGAPTIVGRVNRSRPSDRVILASTDHVVRWHVVARQGINSLEDLKGKRIAYSGVGACSHYIALLLAQKMGWDPVRDLALLGGDYSIFPLKKGWVDAFIAYEVPFAMAKAEGYKAIANLREWNEPIPCSGVNASRSWARNNRETVLRFLKAVVEAISMMKKNKYVAFKAMEKWYGFTDYEVQQILYDGAREMPRKPYPALDGIKKTMQLYDSAQMRRYKPEDFYDDSFIRELDESGFIDKLYAGKK